MKSFIEQQEIIISLNNGLRWNLLDLIIYLGETYFPIFAQSKQFLLGLSSRNKTISRLQNIFAEKASIFEMKMLGTIGNMVVWPWMSTRVNTPKDRPIQWTSLRGLLKFWRYWLRRPCEFWKSINKEKDRVPNDCPPKMNSYFYKWKLPV